jgi:hypothetical protein
MDMEEYSPLYWPEVTVWVAVLSRVVAHCDGCGVVVTEGLIAPLWTHGWYCPGCAAGLRGPTWEEVVAMCRNAAREGEPVFRGPVQAVARRVPGMKPVPVKDGPIAADGTGVRKRTMTPAWRASLEKCWAARREKDAERRRERDARKQVGPPL